MTLQEAIDYAHAIHAEEQATGTASAEPINFSVFLHADGLTYGVCWGRAHMEFNGGTVYTTIAAYADGE